MTTNQISTNITAEELATLEEAKNDTEWNDACLAIKNARGGAFPSDWYQKVMQAGVITRFIKRYGNATGTPIQVIS